MDADRLAQHVATGPSGEVTAELARLVDAERDAEAKLSQLDVDERAAAADVTRLGGELVELERRTARGEPVTAKQRAAIEAAVVAARARVGEPWPERRAALQAVRRDQAARTQAFVATNFAALLAEWEQDSVRAAQRIDAAAQELVDAAAERDRCHQRVEALAQIVLGQTRYADVSPSAADVVVREAEQLLSRGEERAPLLREGLRPGRGVDVEQVEGAVA